MLGVVDILEIIKNNKVINFILKISIILLLMCILVLVLVWNKHFKIGIDVIPITATFSNLIFLAIMLLFVFPKQLPNLINIIKIDFIKIKSLKIILLPIILTLVVDYFIEFSRYLPILIGCEPLYSVGKNQMIFNLSAYSISRFIFLSLSPGVIEELLFRVIPFGLIYPFLLKNIDINAHIGVWMNKPLDFVCNHMHINKRKLFLATFTIFVSTIFSIMHGPDIKNFYFYFIPGLVFSLFYQKYGYLACIIAHTSSNYINLAADLARLTAKFFKII